MQRQILSKIVMSRCVSSSKASELQKEIYTKVAMNYDMICAWGTLFRRKKVLENRLLPEVAFHEGTEFLDAAGGQGAVSLGFVERAHKLGIKNYRVRVYDICQDMLECGKRKLEALPYGKDHVEWIQGDLHELPFEDASFDTFFLCYGIRRIDLERVCQEAYRVLRPGGKILIFDLHRPDNKFVRWLYWDVYMPRVVPYLIVPRHQRSTFHLVMDDFRAIPQREEIESIFKQTKFKHYKFFTCQGGVSACYSGLKL